MLTKIDRIKGETKMREDIAIMYHYVRPPEEWKGSVPISPERFEEQILYFKEHYAIVSPDEMHLETDKPKCVLTFDDATRDQYTYAFPILKKHNVPAYFAIMSGPLQHKKVPTFHLVHTVLSHYEDEKLWEELNKEYPPQNLSKANEIYHYEENLARRYFKYMLNFELEEEQARIFLIEKVLAVYGDLDVYLQEMYIQPEELIEMYEAGMTLGVHCVNHLPYQSPPEKFYEEEIQPCINYMRQELNIDPRWYTPAYGGGTESALMKIELQPWLQTNFTGVFTTVAGNLIKKFWLNRYDCMDFKLKEE